MTSANTATKNNMNKTHNRIYLLCVLTALCMMSCCISPCALAQEDAAAPSVDYAAQIALNMASETVKQEVTVKTFIDGDTTHFNVPESVMSSGVFKARYLAVDTPESTGKVEEYGKKAAQFTREKLENAQSIILESDTGEWNADSTGDRYLVWVWYKPQGENAYRNLNIEILQNGLAIAKSSANNRYGSTCMAALNQAKAQKLHVHSGQKDPDFYYGSAIELTLKEIRCNLEEYNGKKVAFNGIITMNGGNSVYIESYDAETDMYYGMSVYYGYGMNGAGLEILSVGNEARIVGTLQYYEAGGTWQVSGLTYRAIRPTDTGNIQMLSQGHQPAYLLTDAKRFAEGKVDIAGEEETAQFDYAALVMSTSVEMQNLTVIDAYTTDNEESSSNGAMTLTCDADGVKVLVRTAVLRDESGALLTEDMFLGKTISVKGIVDYYDGEYQIKVFFADAITVH